MNRTTRILIGAAPLAAMAVLTAPTSALADGPGPGSGLDLSAGPTDPGPDPAPDPMPGDIAAPDGPTDPEGPGDDPEEEPGEHPGDGIDDLTAPTPCPTHGVDCGGEDPGEDPGDLDQGCFTDCDLPEEDPEPEVKVPYGDDAINVELPTRVDAGAASEPDDGLALSWVLAGGAIVTASGAALAVRRRARASA